MTFTNKATQEMKDRILAYLDDFASGRTNELSVELKSELKLDDQTFQQHAQEAQAAVLHKYSHFSISTIDAFFQRVIRSFTREAGLVGDYRLEVEQNPILEAVIDNLMDELGTNKELTNWVVEFAKENLENERAWDVRSSLISFAMEIFKEEFKEIEEPINLATSERKYFNNLRSVLWEQKKLLLDSLGPIAREALAIVKSHGWGYSDFYYGKNSGLFNFLERCASETNVKELLPPAARVTTDFMIAKNWPSKTNLNPGELIAIAETKLIPLLTKLIKLHSDLYAKAMAAEAVLQNLYVFGLIADISRKLKEYKDENNLMLLADAPKFLNGVIQDSDTPFIYEKVGSFYRNYLIDEFQDTSAMQWKNFLPLLTNSLDQGYTSLVVGDVKQAIYRWRGGDLKLLQENIENQIGSERVAVRELNSNYRSAATLVDFNNLVFEKASARVVEETEHTIAAEAYRDVKQQASQSKNGFVRVRFIEDTDESMWKDEALKQIPHDLEKLQGLGVRLKDIAILVRTNDEGQQIVAHLLKYKDSAEARKDCLYDVVSNESLRLDGAASVNLLLGAMKYLLNPDDVIARAQLGYEFAKLNEPNRSYSEVFAVTSQVFFESNLPESFAREKSSLKKLPLFELTETLISIFKLGEEVGELAYLLAFQNLVLEFYTRERNDLGAFLEWWEDNKQKKSIQVSGEVNAVQVLTIHKAKGLQFKHVIIPFCAWSLDHEPWKAPNLWVTSDEAPFSEVGFVPVKYSSSLTKTTFSHYYEAEKTRTYLDNLNLLYVAFTRAEIGLIVLAPYSKQKKSVSQLLLQSIEESYSMSEHWNSVTHELNLGEWSTADISVPSARSGIVTLSRYGSFRWRDKLVIRQTSKQYLNPALKEKHDKITYGIYIHTVFSRIVHAHEIPNILDELVHDGIIIQEQIPVLQRQLDDLLTNSQIASWFSPEWEVRTEIPIIVPDGSENRIDRLLTKGRKAVVVDFKTGEPTKADQKQVQEYIGVLRKMNYTDVEGYLLYIKDKEIVSVLPGKIKTAGKKDKQQLDLGF